MKIVIPPCARFFLNAILFILYFYIIRILASVIFAFFVVIYLGGSVQGLNTDAAYVFEISSIAIALALDIILIMTHKEHFYLFEKKGR
ncbi:MAG TPA: hypothetical protein VJA22_03820 [Patescibacteria group bacterium]|nr:hypothetical protein [Patescibacteria group bacterium]